MKRLFFTLSLLCCVYDSFSQIQYSGQSEESVKKAINEEGKLKFIRRSVLKDSTTCLVYYPINESNILDIYYFTSNSCDTIKSVWRTKDMIDMIEILNDAFIRINDNIWVSKNKRSKVTLEYEDGSKTFDIYYTNL